MRKPNSRALLEVVMYAEADHWHEPGHLVHILSFALRLPDFARRARAETLAGRRARRDIVHWISLMTMAPHLAEQSAHKARMAQCERSLKNARQQPAAPGARRTLRQDVGRLLAAGDAAYFDACLLNLYCLKLLDLYGLRDKIEKAASDLFFSPRGATYLPPEAFEQWFIWSRSHFFRRAEKSFEDQVSCALRRCTMNKRIDKWIASPNLPIRQLGPAGLPPSVEVVRPAPTRHIFEVQLRPR